MGITTIREKVVEEVNQIPEEKLPYILDLIHHFRIGLQLSRKRSAQTFAGCWQDMPENQYDDFLNEINERRKNAFSKRRGNEADIG